MPFYDPILVFYYISLDNKTLEGISIDHGKYVFGKGPVSACYLQSGWREEGRGGGKGTFRDLA